METGGKDSPVSGRQKIIMHQRTIFNLAMPITVVRYQAANSLLLCATHGGSVYGFNAADDFRVLFRLETGLADISGLDVHPQEKVAAVAGMGTHQIWDLSAQRCLMNESFAPYNQGPPGYGSGFCLRFHHSGWAIFGGYSFSFRAYNYKTGERRELFAGADYNVWLDFHPSGDIGLASILYPQDSAEIRFFDFKPSGEYVIYSEPKILFLPDGGLPSDIPVRSIFSPRGNSLLSTTTNSYYLELRQDIEKRGALLGAVLVHGFPDYELLHEVEILGALKDLEAYPGSGPAGETLYGAHDVLSNPAALALGDYCVCGTPSGDLALVDCKQGKVAYQESVHSGRVLSIDAVSLYQVVSGSMDGTLRLCDFAPEIGKGRKPEDVGSSVHDSVLASEREFFAVAAVDEDAWQPPTTPSSQSLLLS